MAMCICSFAYCVDLKMVSNSTKKKSRELYYALEIVCIKQNQQKKRAKQINEISHNHILVKMYAMLRYATAYAQMYLAKRDPIHVQTKCVIHDQNEPRTEKTHKSIC